MKGIIYCVTIAILLMGCGSSKKTKTIKIEPSEEILNKMLSNDFSIVLNDMKIDEEKDFIAYKHKYNVLKIINDSLHEEKLPWKYVNQSFFKKHENDLGMEILSRHNGKVSRIAQPVGFGWAIGNENHGDWEVVDSTKTNKRRWRHSRISPFFWYWLGSFSRRNIYNNDYRGYQNSQFNKKPYYGSRSGKYDYGTRSSFQKSERPHFFERKKLNNSRWNRLSKRSSRYSRSSSIRSRSGGFGK